LVDVFQDLVHQQSDAGDGEAGTDHQQDAGGQRYPFGVAVHECLDQRRSGHRGGHLGEEQHAHGDGDLPS
jgi:hypothetical protein